MNKLEELIQQYCPNGVNFRPLGEVCSSIRTGKLNANEKDEDGLYPFFTCDAEPYRINTYAFDCEAILITGNGSQVGHINYYKGKFNAYQRTYVLSSFIETVDVFFVLHYFRAYLKEYILVNSKKGSVPYITLPMLQNFLIPIPPLPVQEEIVRVLDTFTELQAELQAELQKRLQQYEYYRDNLIQKHCVGVEYKPLCELGTFYSGLTGKSKDDFSGGNAKFITYVNIFNHPSLETDVEEKVKIAEGEKQNTVQYGDMLFTGSSETPDECGMCSVLTHHTDEEMYLNSFCFGFRFNDLNDKSPDFMKHLFRSTDIRKKICKTANGVTRFNISKKEFAKIEIPLLPLDVQVKLAAILDRFFTLTTDLTAGLPAEIEKRKQQYEYYRDKLLTFKRITK
jgi:type I restriction enzyme S subunit